MLSKKFLNNLVNELVIFLCFCKYIIWKINSHWLFQKKVTGHLTSAQTSKVGFIHHYIYCISIVYQHLVYFIMQSYPVVQYSEIRPIGWTLYPVWFIGGHFVSQDRLPFEICLFALYLPPSPLDWSPAVWLESGCCTLSQTTSVTAARHGPPMGTASAPTCLQVCADFCT